MRETTSGALDRLAVARLGGLVLSQLVLAGFVLTYVAVAALVWPERFAVVLGLYLLNNLGLILSVFLVGIVLHALIRAPKNPASLVVELLLGRAAWAACVFVLFVAGVAAYTTYKVAIPEVVPFHADAFLAGLDASVFGADPWLLTHEALPALAAPYLNFVYGMVWFVLWFGMALLVAFSRDRMAATRYFWALALTTVICGTVLAAALSSVGPIYYDRIYGGDRFAALTAVIYGELSFTAVAGYADHLMRAYEAGEAHFGSGISAAPSMHVAIVVLNAFLLSNWGRWAGLFGWAFAALIMFGSVYTGWHYAVDGLMSAAVVALIWWLTGLAHRNMATAR